MNFLKKILAYARLHKKLSAVAIILAGIVIFFSVRNGAEEAPKTTAVMRGDILQEVSVTGRVKSAQAVDLLFEKTGRIAAVNVKVGDKVRQGQALIRLDASELSAQRYSAVANIQSAQNKLDQLISGARTEDVAVLKTTLESAERTLLAERTSETLSVARAALNKGITALVTFTEMQTEYYTVFMNSSTIADQVADAKAKALGAMVGGTGGDLGRTSAEYFLGLNGGLKAEIAYAEAHILTFNAKQLLGNAKNALALVRDALEIMQAKLSGISGVSSTDVTTVGTSLDTVNAQISALSTQEQAITTAENAVKDAQAKLTLKEAPAEQYDIDIARSTLEQAKASLAVIDAQLAKMSLLAPIDGTVTVVNGARGEITDMTVPAVSLIGTARFEIDADVAEADIAKINVGNAANVTLDAYGDDIIFPAHVIHIDPAGKLIEGVAAYRVTFQFDQENEKILAGLTANIDIQTAQRNGVLYAPSRDIIQDGRDKAVEILIPDDDGFRIVSAPIQTGLKGSDGRTEVLSGVSEGDLIVAQ